MRNYGPKPLIEEHHHIEELINNQQKRSDDRDYHRARVASLEERQKLIDDSLMIDKKDFHCSRCKVDFQAGAILQVEQDWSNPNQSIAFYKSKHRVCGRWSIRLVTDRQKDGYFIRSRLMRLEQGQHYADLVQPHENGFNLLYGKR